MARLVGIATGCIRCGEKATQIIINFPLCDRCAKAVSKKQ